MSVLSVIPSQRVFFVPLRGQFEAAFKLKPAGGPPLSVENTITLFFSIPFLRSASTTWPTDSSSLLSIPAIKSSYRFLKNKINAAIVRVIEITIYNLEQCIFKTKHKCKHTWTLLSICIAKENTKFRHIRLNRQTSYRENSDYYSSFFFFFLLSISRYYAIAPAKNKMVLSLSTSNFLIKEINK